MFWQWGMVDSNNDPTFVDIAIPANTSNSRRFVFEVFWSFPPNLFWCSVESVLKTLEGTPGWETGNAFNGHSPKQEKSADLSTSLSFIGSPSIHCYLQKSTFQTERSIEPSDWLGAGQSSWCSESCRKRSKRARCAKRRSLWRFPIFSMGVS